jgi:hypothetical protein
LTNDFKNSRTLVWTKSFKAINNINNFFRENVPLKRIGRLGGEREHDTKNMNTGLQKQTLQHNERQLPVLFIGVSSEISSVSLKSPKEH